MNIVRSVCLAAAIAAIVSTGPDMRDGASAAAAPSLTKSEPALTSHRATYRLSLLRTVPGDGVRAARGTMIYTIADRCDGYTIESNVSMDLAFGDGNSQKVDQRYAAWESKNGRFSSFTMQNLEDGAASKSYRGTIKLEADGSGTAAYEAEEPTVFKLSPGTMLSTAHTVALLRSAAAGKSFYSGNVIDGSFDRGPFLVTALIAKAKSGAAAIDDEKGRDLSAGRYWPMSLAYFHASSQGSLPEYELGMDLLPTGISRAMAQDFGDFTIGFTLVELEPLKPEC